MIKMKSIYRKTGMIVAVVALLVVMFAPTAVADFATLGATFDGTCIVVECTDFPVKQSSGSKYFQYRFYQPITTPYDEVNPDHTDLYNETTNPDGFFVSKSFLVEPTDPPYNDTYLFNVMEPNIDPYGEWGVMLFKGGSDSSDPMNVLDSQKSVWVPVDVPIPEFATIAIPAIALLGLFAFYRRKQKK